MAQTAGAGSVRNNLEFHFACELKVLSTAATVFPLPPELPSPQCQPRVEIAKRLIVRRDGSGPGLNKTLSRHRHAVQTPTGYPAN